MNCDKFSLVYNWFGHTHHSAFEVNMSKICKGSAYDNDDSKQFVKGIDILYLLTAIAALCILLLWDV